MAHQLSNSLVAKYPFTHQSSSDTPFPCREGGRGVRLKRLPFLSLTLTFIFLLATTALGYAATRIAGQVTNATHNAPAAGATVQLFRPNGSGQPWTAIKATKVGGNGHFDFGPLELATDDLLIARVEWQGYPYEVPAYDGAGRLKQLDPDISIHPADLMLQVFDATTQPPPLTAKWHQVAIEAKDRDLKCSERVVIENTSRQTFLGEGAQHVTVRLHLPTGAHDVELDPEIKDATLTHTGDTVEIAKPITPVAYNNENSISFNYVMSWPLSLPWNRALDLSRKIDYPTRFFFVARAEGDKSLKVIAPQLGADRTVALPIGGDQQPHIMNSIGAPMVPRASIEAGTQVAITVSRATNPLVWAFVIFVVALCLMVPLALVRGGRGRSDETMTVQNNASHKITEPTLEASVNGGIPSSSGGYGQGRGVLSDRQLPAAAKELIDKIARLDDEWDNGEIGAEAYQNQRAMWKERLVELLSVNR